MTTTKRARRWRIASRNRCSGTGSSPAPSTWSRWQRSIGFNVPLNNHLDTVDPATLSVADVAREWQAYFSTWTAWNHARTVTAIIASALMLIRLRYR